MTLEERLERNILERGQLEYQKALIDRYTNPDPVEYEAEQAEINRRLNQNKSFGENILRLIASLG